MMRPSAAVLIVLLLAASHRAHAQERDSLPEEPPESKPGCGAALNIGARL
jgi:hypothetical protein